MATHSSVFAWEILWTEELGGLQPTGTQSWMRLSALSGESALSGPQILLCSLVPIFFCL